MSRQDVQQERYLDYRPLSAVIQQLPRDGKWTQAHRDNWLRAMKAVVDLLVENEEPRG